jgi:diguanylate cyclase (GGDEF)-like protein/PAS domain S-box-containing protein
LPVPARLAPDHGNDSHQDAAMKLNEPDMPAKTEAENTLEREEQSRLDALRAYDILDTPAEPALDRLTSLVASICGTPIATLTFVDEGRQWFKSAVGLEIREIDRADGFCARAIQGTGLYMVPDAAKDPVFATNAAVAGPSGIRFYAGVPLLSPGGYALGTLAVMDRVPRSLDDLQSTALKTLAEQVMMQLELRRQRRALGALTPARVPDITKEKAADEDAARLAIRLLGMLDGITDAIYTLDRRWRFTYLNKEAAVHLRQPRKQLLGKVIWDEYKEAVGSIAEREFHRAFRENRPVQFEQFYAPLQLWCEIRAYPSEEGLAVSFHDISARKQAEQAIRESEERFKHVATATADGIWDWDAKSDRLWWNEGMHALFGFPPEETEPGIESWSSRIHPDDKDRVLHGVHAVVSGGGENWTDEYRVVRHDGTFAHVLDRGFVIRDREGQVLRIVGGMTDQTARKRSELDLARLNRALRMRSSSNELLIHSKDETALITDLCRLAVDVGGYRMAWVGYAQDDETRTITPAAYASGPDDTSYVAGLRFSWSEDEPTGRGLAGQAIRSGQPIFSENLRGDATFYPWLAAAEERGYRGVICLPLRDKERAFGVLTLYSHEVRPFSAEEVKLMQELADNLAFGIGSLRSQEERRRIQAAVRKVAASVSASAGAEFFEQLASNMAEAAGAQGAFVARFLPGEPIIVRTVAAVIDGRPVDNVDYAIEGSPCEKLLREEHYVVPAGVAGLFPRARSIADFGAQAYVGGRLDNSAGQPMGLLFVLFREPLKRYSFIKSTLRIFATRAAAELERQEADARISDQASLLDKAKDAIVVRGIDNRVQFWNKGAERLYGWTSDEALGRSIEELLYDDPSTLEEATRSVLEQGEWSGEILGHRKDGSSVTIEANWTLVRDDDGRPQSILAIKTDITQRKAAEREIQRLAFYDGLTRLPNRLLLMERLQHALTISARSRKMGAVLFIDLDNFKTLNDTLGHDKGDLLLQQVSQRLTACVRESDTVARLGGDEFVVMLEDLSESPQEAIAQTKAIGEKILAAVNRPYQLAGHERHSTPSIGATLFNGLSGDADELLKRADLAMYQAKAAGRNAIRFFDPKMQAAATDRAALEADFRQGLRQQEFLLHYQPQLCAEDCVVGAEVLVRWQQPRRGLVSPAEFIPLAEETGLILPLGKWVLETACRQLASWAACPAMARLTMAVNVSARQFRDPGFVKQVLAVLDRTGANPQLLKLELTESLLVENVEETIAKMSALKARGVGFSLDDFGTGYSSLSYLKRLPLDQLKIDESFVRDVLTDPNDAVITRTIIALGQSLGLEVIAEGVETEEQRAFLAELDCHAYQGYLFCRPLPAEQFERFMRDRNVGPG